MPEVRVRVLALCFSDLRELELRAAGFLQHHPLAGNFQLINCRGIRRFNFDPILIAELVPASDVAGTNGAVV